MEGWTPGREEKGGEGGKGKSGEAVEVGGVRAVRDRQGLCSSKSSFKKPCVTWRHSGRPYVRWRLFDLYASPSNGSLVHCSVCVEIVFTGGVVSESRDKSNGSDGQNGNDDQQEIRWQRSLTSADCRCFLIAISCKVQLNIVDKSTIFGATRKEQQQQQQ